MQPDGPGASDSRLCMLDGEAGAGEEGGYFTEIPLLKVAPNATSTVLTLWASYQGHKTKVSSID